MFLLYRECMDGFCFSFCIDITFVQERWGKKTTNERKTMTETVLAIGSVQIIINKMLNKKATNHKFCFCILLCRQTTHTHTTIMMVSEFNTFCVCVYVFLLPFFVLWAWLNLDGFNNEKQRHAKRKWITNKSDTNKHSINTHTHTHTHMKGPEATPRLLYK